ncbi:MAG: hypothetical protein LBD33_01180 [Puniceicoccales bacterium]|nr:hypothetical protein [Puniceicoccales bacterium]
MNTLPHTSRVLSAENATFTDAEYTPSHLDKGAETPIYALLRKLEKLAVKSIGALLNAFHVSRALSAENDTIFMDKEIALDLNQSNKDTEIVLSVFGIAAVLTVELQSFGVRVRIFSCDTIHPNA